MFFALRSLKPGDAVRHPVRRPGGALHPTAVHEVPKARFPTEAVYAPTARAELRLITCGGRFDRAARNYVDNVVVDAVAADDVTDSDEYHPSGPTDRPNVPGACRPTAAVTLPVTCNTPATPVWSTVCSRSPRATPSGPGPTVAPTSFP